MGWGSIYFSFYVSLESGTMVNWLRSELCIQAGLGELSDSPCPVIPKVGSSKEVFGVGLIGRQQEILLPDEWPMFAGECAVLFNVPWSSSSLSK